MEDLKSVVQLQLEIEKDPSREIDSDEKASTVIFIVDMGRNVIPKNALLLVVGKIRKTPTSSGKCSNRY